MTYVATFRRPLAKDFLLGEVRSPEDLWQLVSGSVDTVTGFPADLPALDLRPAVLRTLLKQPPSGHPQYILNREQHATT